MGQVVKQLVKGEVGTKEYFNIKQFNSAGLRVAKDLTGATITIFIYGTDRTTASKIVDGGACTIEGAAGNGQVSFTVTAASANTVNRYLGRLKIVIGGETSWTKEFQWNVEDNPG